MNNIHVNTSDQLTTPRLFYDGGCRLCQREIAHLAQPLAGKMQLVDINDPAFSEWQGVDKLQMMRQIHVWTGERFLVGLDASLYYWRAAGWRVLPWLLSLPGVYQCAKLGYALWANWRFRDVRKRQCRI
jgi:predicted DCC family thiol-disulfide oxidoreductase YuxK